MLSETLYLAGYLLTLARKTTILGTSGLALVQGQRENDFDGFATILNIILEQNSRGTTPSGIVDLTGCQMGMKVLEFAISTSFRGKSGVKVRKKELGNFIFQSIFIIAQN